MTSPLIYGPQIETERLILRPPMAEDFQNYCRFYADITTMTHLGGVVPAAVVWQTLRSRVGQWVLDGHSMFFIFLKDSGDFIGQAGPHYPYGWPGREVGWGLISTYWGRGYAYEAAKASMDYAFDVLGWDEVCHVIAPENRSSQALAQRLGSHNQGPTSLPHPHKEKRVDLWRQTKSQWRAHK